MPQILIIDASPICRELLAKTLEGAGFEVACAQNSAQATVVLSSTKPDLLIIDPATDSGVLRLIETLRQTSKGHRPAVIVLTELMDKASVLRAGQLGIRDYMLKQRFSLAELLIRVQKNVRTSDSIAPEVATALARPIAAMPILPPTTVLETTGIVPSSSRRLSREQTLSRVEACTQAKTLPGVVTEIIGLVNSPRGAISDVVQALKRDPVLAARVLQVANSAAFVSQKPRITSVDDAVRNIGTSGVRTMVLSVGIFESFTPEGPSSLDVLRFWQHSFAVAAIMERIVPVSDAAPPGAAHLVGLCHDLTELALSQQFPEEYTAAADLSKQSGEPTYRSRSVVLGLPYHELAVALLRKMGLPPMITVPIEEVLERSALGPQAGNGSILARALRMANMYANALMLPSGPDASITPFSISECRGVFEKGATPVLDDFILRSESLTMVNMLSGVTSREIPALCRPTIDKSDVRIWYSRHPGYADFDPLVAWLRMVGVVEVHAKLPALASELDACDVVVLAAARQCNPLTLQQQISELLKATSIRAKPVIYLSGVDPQHISAGSFGSSHKLPVQMPQLAETMKACLASISSSIRASAA
ncbi:MAG TPA: HDOD domain-containing protein [Tepidisphaeraceae bacterium]|jgi:HD-like signal output (HDOD) protein/ActR/RegA family two-component response regulator